MLEILEQEVKKHVTQLFEQADTAKLFYHNYQHTDEVVQRIAVLTTDLNPSDLFSLKIAGWFHDLGYLHSYKEHEEKGMFLAKNYLKNKLDTTTINLIIGCIEATKMGFKPRNTLERIIKDADIGYGVTERFMQTGTLLRKEWEAFLGKFYTDKDWEILQYEFLTSVQFHTDVAQEKYGPILQQNILQQKNRVL
ncbi:MAG: HD domain-containing protein [Aureispira sp.]|nr:HD domain-containing protein [Aureispira sp.]